MIIRCATLGKRFILSEDADRLPNPQHASARRFLEDLRRCSRERLESCRSCQFNSPHGTAGVERTFQFDESGGIASKNPHVRVWRLFPQEPCHQSSYTSDFYLHDVAYRFVFGVATCYRFLAFWKDLKFYHSRFWSGRHHGNRGLWHIWLNVLHQGEQQSIRDVGRQVTPLPQDLLAAVLILISDRDLA